MQFNHPSNAGLKQAGFTLIEIMLVALVVAVTAAAIATRLSPNLDRIALEEANRFIRITRAAYEYSVFTGRVMRVQFDENNGYKVALLDPSSNSWNEEKAAKLNDFFEYHQINKEIITTIDKETLNKVTKNKKNKRQDESDDNEDSKDNQKSRQSKNNKKEPLDNQGELIGYLVFSPFGQVPAFEYQLKAESKLYTVKAGKEIDEPIELKIKSL